MMKLPVPPRTTKEEIEMFGREEVSEIATQKLANLEDRWGYFENVVSLKEPVYYKQLEEKKEYSVPWLTAMVKLYSIERKRDNFKKWYRYWQRLIWDEVRQEETFGSFSQEDVEKAREYPIEELLETNVKNAGGGKLKTPCPFHEETLPSFFIYNDNSYHCFGCQKHGNNAIDFLVDTGLTFQEAVKRLL